MYSLVYVNDNNGKKVVKLCKARNAKHAQTISDIHEVSIYPDIDPSGNSVVYAFGNDIGNLGLKLHDVRTNETKILLQPTGKVFQPKFASNGKVVIFSATLNCDKNSIFTIDTETKQLQKIVSDSENYYYFPSAAQDLSFFVYQENNSNGTRNVILNHVVDEKITHIDQGMSPSLSKDQNKIAYTKKIDGNWDIFVYDRVSKQKSRITKYLGNDFAPAFDHLGNILFASDRLNDTLNIHKIEDKTVAALTNNEQGANYSPRVGGLEMFQQSYLSEIPGEPRSSVGCTQYKNKVYVVGGHLGQEHTYPPESFVGTLDIYDLDSSTWTKGPDRPHKCHGFSIAAYNDFIYAFGGFAYSDEHMPRWKSLDVVDRYNIRTKKWETCPTMPRKRSSNVVAQIGNKVYLIGGWDSTPKHDNDTEGKFHEEIDVFDLETQSFRTMDAKLQMKRRAFSGFVDDNSGTIYLVGGISEGSENFALLDNVTSFNASNGRFTEVTKLPFPTFAPATGIIGNEMYVFGGLLKTGRYSYEYVPHIYKFDLYSSEWIHTGRYLKEAKGFSQIIQFHEKLGIIGGHTYLKDSDTPVSTFETFRVQELVSKFITAN